MSIHSLHTDPWTRARANELLRQAGYRVQDPTEIPNFAKFNTARLSVQGELRVKRLAAVFGVGSVFLAGSILVMLNQQKVVTVTVENGQVISVIR